MVEATLEYLWFHKLAIQFGVIASGYTVFAIYCAVQLIMVMHLHSLRKSWQPLFYPFVLIGCLVRAACMVLHPLIHENYVVIENKYVSFLTTFPSFVFFAGYLALLFCWAQIYHNTHKIGSSKFQLLRLVFLVIVAVMFLSVIVLYGYDWYTAPTSHRYPPVYETTAEKVTAFYIASIYFTSSFGFLVYAILLASRISQQRGTRGSAQYVHYRSVAGAGDRKRERSEIEQVTRRIHYMTMLVMVVFIARTGIVALDGSLDISSKFWLFDGLYWIILELTPLALMVRILKMDTDATRAGANNNDGGLADPLLPRAKLNPYFLSSQQPHSQWHSIISKPNDLPNNRYV